MTTTLPPDPFDSQARSGQALTPAHRRQLEHDSAIPDDILSAEGVRSLASSHQLPVPDTTFRHPNSYKGQTFPSWPDLGPGILFPISTVSDALTYQYKADAPRGSIADGTPIKYETCGGSRLALHVPRSVRRWLKHRTRHLWITEGAKKVLSGAAAGLAIIGLMGVDGWVVKSQPNLPSDPLPDWDAIHLQGRVVFIAFDSDVMTKDGVRAALGRLRRFLEGRGATVVPVIIPHGPDGEKRGLDDHIAARIEAGVTREEAVAELETAALIAELSRPKRPEPPTGGDGGAACDGHCPTSTALREQVREYKAADQLVRDGPFSPTTAQIVKYHVEQAAIIRHNGQAKGALERPRVAAAANVNEKAVTRAWREWEQLQADPEVKATLPYLLERRTDERGREHVDIVVPTVDAPPSRAQMYITTRQLPRLRPAHGGERAPTKLPPENPPCRKCGEAMATHRTRQDVCLNDACDTVVTYPTRITRPPREGPIVMHGAVFSVAATPSQGDEGQDVPRQNGTNRDEGHLVPSKNGAYEGHLVPRLPTTTPIPVSFATRDDLALFAAPHYLGEPPPEPPPPWQPPPLAPSSHRAAGFRRAAALPVRCVFCPAIVAPGSTIACPEHERAMQDTEPPPPTERCHE